MKQKLYPNTSSFISEAHFKLSLAYEFSVEEDEEEETEENKEKNEIPPTEKITFKELAVEEMKNAIEIVREREKAGENKDPTLLKDLESRLKDLKNAVEVAAAAAAANTSNNNIGGIPSSSSSSSSLLTTQDTSGNNSIAVKEAQQKAEVLLGLIGQKSSGSIKDTIAQVIGSANDVSSLVRKSKKKKPVPTTTTTSEKTETTEKTITTEEEDIDNTKNINEISTKRKLEDDESTKEEIKETEKKQKTE